MSPIAHETLLSRFCPRPEAPAVFGAHGPFSVETLLRRASLVAAVLPPPTPDSEVAFAFGRDRAAFVAALLGTWLAGHRAALPEDARRENVVAVLSRPNNVAFLHDTGVGRGVWVPDMLAKSAAGELPPDQAIDWQRDLLLTFDGQHQEQRIGVASLLAQVDEWGEAMKLAPGSCLVSALSPTSRDEVVRGILVPLRAGALFGAEVPRSTSALREQVVDHQASAVLATPWHLRGLAAEASGALEPLATVFSCPDPLDEGARQQLEAGHGLQVFGPNESAGEGDKAVIEALVEAAFAVQDVADAGALILPRAAGQGRHALLGVVAPESVVEAVRAASRGVLRSDEVLEVRAFPALPRTVYGTLSAPDLFLRFGRGRDGKELAWALDWDELPVEEGSPARGFGVKIPESYGFFEGHFTPYPVLAGAVQLHELVLPCIRRVAAGVGPLQKLSGVKFLARIAPGDEVVVTVRPASREGSWQFDISRGTTRCSVGRLSFAGEASS